MRITVVGLGKIGLPLAVQFAMRGHHVVGADIEPTIVRAVRQARPPFPGEAGLADRMEHVVGAGLLAATTDTSAAVAESDAVIVVVPLFVDTTGEPDFGAIDAATADVGTGLKRGALVVYETTLPVGTVRNRLAPHLERLSGLEAGADFFLAFSPERVSSGRVFADLSRYPKLVGGINAESTKRAVAVYASGLDFEERTDLPRPNGVWAVGSCEAAEFAKLAETTYRDVNIGLANQFALYAHRVGVDFHEVIEACNSQPYSNLHTPGIAVGGHCIPVYPWFYLAGDPDAAIVRTARAANSAMPDRSIDLLEDAYGDLSGAVVVVLGACYRGGVKETAFSGVFSVVRALKQRNALPMVHDPLFTAAELADLGLRAYSPGEPVDAAVVQADHRDYVEWSNDDLPGVRVVLDGRALLDRRRWRGVRIVTIGRGVPDTGPSRLSANHGHVSPHMVRDPVREVQI